MFNPRVLMKNMTSMAAMRIIAAALSFFLVVCIARFWGTEPMGRFALLSSLFIFLQQMPLLGLHLVLIRDSAARPETVPAQIANALAIALGAGTILALGLGVAGSVLYRDDMPMRLSVALVALCVIPTGFICVIESVLIGQERMHLVAKWNVAENIIRTALSLLALWLGMDLVAVFSVFLLGRLILVAAYFKALHVHQLLQGVLPHRAGIAAYLRQVPTFLGIMVCSASINRLDFLLLPALGSAHALGLYSAPYKVYEMALMAPSLITIVLMPMFASQYQKSPERLARLIEAAIRLLLLAAIPCVGVAAFFARPIMSLFGPDFIDTAWVLQLMLVSLLFVTLNQLLSLVMLVSHQQVLDFKALMWSCIAYALLLLLLIPRWGMGGAAAATFAVAVLQPGLRYVMLRARGLLPPLGVMLGTMATACAAMFAAYGLVNAVAPLLAAAGAIAVYAVAVWLMKGITASNLRGYKRLVTAEDQ
jgi:O-antigen/teichoic acid export membrane protein